jgi:hypothetical protein
MEFKLITLELLQGTHLTIPTFGCKSLNLGNVKTFSSVAIEIFQICQQGFIVLVVVGGESPEIFGYMSRTVPDNSLVLLPRRGYIIVVAEMFKIFHKGFQGVWESFKGGWGT